MRIIGIALLILAMVGVSAAQSRTPSNDPPDLQVVNIGKKIDSRVIGPPDVRSESKSALSPNSPTLSNAQPVSAVHVPMVAGFSYQVTVRNVGTKEIKSVTWMYVLTDSLDGSVMARHAFKMKIKISPDSDKKLEGFSISPPSKVVNAKTVEENPNKPFNEQVLIVRIEYTDGSVWERQSR